MIAQGGQRQGRERHVRGKCQKQSLSHNHFSRAPCRKGLGFRLRTPVPASHFRPGFDGDCALAPSANRLTWCTGEDSNLRTSLGGTDLQSVGFNHSPTCARQLLAANTSLEQRLRQQAHSPLPTAKAYRGTPRPSFAICDRQLGSESARKNQSAPTSIWKIPFG